MPDTDPRPEARLPFSTYRRHADLIFVSGQASTDKTGAIVSDDFDGEFHRALGNVRTILHEAGTDLHNVIQVRAYVRDAVNLPLYNRLYRQYFSEPYPARTTLTGCLPETIQFEIDCVAIADGTITSARGLEPYRTEEER